MKVFLALSMAISLAACGSDGTSNESPTVAGNGASDPERSDPAQPVPPVSTWPLPIELVGPGTRINDPLFTPPPLEAGRVSARSGADNGYPIAIVELENLTGVSLYRASCVVDGYFYAADELPFDSASAQLTDSDDDDYIPYLGIRVAEVVFEAAGPPFERIEVLCTASDAHGFERINAFTAYHPPLPPADPHL